MSSRAPSRMPEVRSWPKILAEDFELGIGAGGLAISPDRPAEMIKLLVVGGCDRLRDEADGVDVAAVQQGLGMRRR